MSKINLNLTPLAALPVDWEQIMENIKARVQANLPNTWTDFLASNMGVEILENIAFESAREFYYTNMALQNCFLYSANTRDAVFRIAKQMGYRPKPAQQSYVTLKFYIDEARDYDIYIPMYTKISSIENNQSFYTTEATILYAGGTSIEVMAASGNLNTDTFISNGEADYFYQLLKQNVNKVLSVTVDDLVYEQLDFIDVKDSEGLYYVVRFDHDYFGYVGFGNGTYGVNPNPNQLIKVLYVSGSDSNSNVSPDTIIKINDSIFNSNSEMVSELKVTNPDYATGGTDYESMADIKRNTPTIYKTQKRAVTISDWEDLIYAVGGIQDVKALDNKTMDEIGIFGVKLCIVPKDTMYITNAFKLELKKYFEERKITATQFEFVDPSYIVFDANIDAVIYPTYNASVVTNKIKKVVTDYLSYKNRELGQKVSKDELYSLISEVEGIANINDISISENRVIYVEEAPADKSSVIRIKDTIQTINIGSVITIMNNQGIAVITGKVIDINKDEYTLLDIKTGKPVMFEMDMGISKFCEVCPLLYTSVDLDYGDKIVYIKNDDLTDGNVSRRNIMLNNLTYSTIYFGDDITNTYQILFRVGDKIYLNKEISKEIPKETPIFVKYKKMIPVVEENTGLYSSTIKLTEYPRFDVGANVFKENTVSYRIVTLNCQRSRTGIDYIADYTDMETFVNIRKVYLNDENILIEGEDYTLEDEGTSINWTEQGKTKVPTNKIYFVDIVKKEVESSTVKYYVTNIKDKTLTISPRVKEMLYEGNVLNYETNNYKLMPYEIADVGEIKVHLNF